MIHSTLYSCDICHQPYNSTGTGGVTTWSWAGVGADHPLDLCPECLGKVRGAIQELQDEHLKMPKPGANLTGARSS